MRPWLTSTARLTLSSRVGSGGSAPAGDVHPGCCCVNSAVSTVRSGGVVVVSVFRVSARDFGLKPHRRVCPVVADRRTAPARANDRGISSQVSSPGQRCEQMQCLRLGGVTAGWDWCWSVETLSRPGGFRGLGFRIHEKDCLGFTRMNDGLHVRGCSGHRTKPKAL